MRTPVACGLSSTALTGIISSAWNRFFPAVEIVQIGGVIGADVQELNLNAIIIGSEGHF